MLFTNNDKAIKPVDNIGNEVDNIDIVDVDSTGFVKV